MGSHGIDKVLAGAMIAALLLTALAHAQPRRAVQAPQTARQAAPVDLTGYWVSVVSEEWRWRMVTPTRGDFANIPLNAEGRRVGMQWDPEGDAAAGLECKAYGAPAIMRIPGRVHISWTDDETLTLETDAGTQTRTFRFGAPATTTAPRSRQGYSVANWERPPRGIAASEGLSLFSGQIGRDPRSLEVTTTNLLAGYLRKNGAPFSEDAVVNEYYDYYTLPNGDAWFTVTTVVTDPTYLNGVYITSSDFKKETGDDAWNPTPCTVR